MRATPFPLLLILVLAAACSDLVSSRPMPSQGYRYLDLALDESFDAQGAWRGYQGAGFTLGVQAGRFLIDIQDRQYVWTQNDLPLDDLVLEADLRQTSSHDHNAFGLACRLDSANSGRGYFFLISGDGYASIRWSNGRSLEAIAPAQPSAHINRGMARNRLRAVCIDDYLALWVNDQFVLEARDQRASSGSVGLAGVVNYQGKNLTLTIDDLKVWRAALAGRAP